MITYHELNLQIDSGRILHLLSEHTLEVFGEGSNFDLCYMFKLIELNLVRSYIVCKDKKIIGYTMYVLTKDMFRAGRMQAECTAFYVSPENRGSYEVPTKLLAFSENMLKGRGINEIIVATNLQKRLANLYKRVGYTEQNTYVSKEL